MTYAASPDSRAFEQDSLLKISQHELISFLPPEERSDQRFVHCVARACLPHCIAAIDETGDATSDSHISELIDFLEEYGAHDQPGQGRTEYYRDGVGWLHTPLADRERNKGKAVIMQNLAYGSDADIQAAVISGRVRSYPETAVLADRMQFGGSDRSRWLEAIGLTIDQNGSAIPMLLIPKLDGKGYGGHSVLVQVVKDGNVVYFDPDQHAISRYGDDGAQDSGIERVQSAELYYRQPVDKFVARMTGEVMHIFDHQPEY